MKTKAHVSPDLLLRSLALTTFTDDLRPHYPFNLPLIQALPQITFTSSITFLVGENGSGKSTLLEALACAIGSITVGSTDLRRDATLAPARALAQHMRLSWTKKTQKGLFLRAEDYFGYVKKMSEMRTDLEEDLRRVNEENKHRSALAQSYARLAYAKELSAIKHRYGEGLDTRSHGESFLDFFSTRFVPNGLYLLDEPEAPLSPYRQITLLALLKHMVSQGAQFIIATHSPILMAYPGATILHFNKDAIEPVVYDEVEHVSVTKSFLKNPDAFLRHL